MNDSNDFNEAIIESSNEGAMSAYVTKRITPLRKLASIFPRCYYFTTQVILPLLVLIGLCFLFGWAIAKIESRVEIESNNEAIADAFREHAVYKMRMESLHQSMTEIPYSCAGGGSIESAPSGDNNNNSTENSTAAATEDNIFLPAATEEVKKCALARANEEYPIESVKDHLYSLKPALSFEWITCDRASNSSGVVEAKYDRYVMDFFDDYESKLVLSSSKEEEGIDTDSLLISSDGSKTCKPHFAAGALFWFTLMTTIG